MTCCSVCFWHVHHFFLLCLGPPKASIKQQTVSVNASDPFNIACSGSGTPPPIVYWNTDDLWSNVSVTSSDDGMTQTMFVISSDIRDNGWVSCTAENVATRIKEQFRLLIYGAYEIK